MKQEQAKEFHYGIVKGTKLIAAFVWEQDRDVCLKKLLREYPNFSFGGIYLE